MMEIIIPNTVAPYPDELLGSWLSRLKVHNHSSLIQLLAGLDWKGKVASAGWRDILYSSIEFERLMTALGTSYEEAMLELTTYPYWMRFHSSAEYNFSRPGMVQGIPQLLLKDRKYPIPRLRYLLPQLTQICPICLDQDFRRFGEPYLHRAHHLPFVKTCHIHRVELISRCPNCGHLFRMRSTYTHTQLACDCGQDLRATLSLAMPQNSWTRLTDFSSEVLFCKEPVEKCETFYDFFDFEMDRVNVLKRPDLLNYLSNEYGSNEAKAILTLAPQRSDASTFAAIGSLSKHEFRAPQVCAFLSTVFPTFAQSNEQFLSFINTPDAQTTDDGRKHGYVARAMLPASVQDARCLVEQVQQLNGKSTLRSYLYRRHKTLFWYLTIFDKEWFESNYPPGNRGATLHLPSIDSDRLSILQAIANAPIKSVRVWKNLCQQAFIRSSLRDLVWLKMRMQETAFQIKQERLQKNRRFLEDCIADLNQAIKKAQCEENLPFNTFLSKIAPYMKLNKDQLRHIFSKNPSMLKRLSLGFDPAFINQHQT